MVWTVVSWSWGIRPVCSPVYGLPGGGIPSAWCMVTRNVLAGPVGGPGEQVRRGCVRVSSPPSG